MPIGTWSDSDALFDAAVVRGTLWGYWPSLRLEADGIGDGAFASATAKTSVGGPDKGQLERLMQNAGHDVDDEAVFAAQFQDLNKDFQVGMDCVADCGPVHIGRAGHATSSPRPQPGTASSAGREAWSHPSVPQMVGIAEHKTVLPLGQQASTCSCCAAPTPLTTFEVCGHQYLCGDCVGYMMDAGLHECLMCGAEVAQTPIAGTVDCQEFAAKPQPKIASQIGLETLPSKTPSLEPCSCCREPAPLVVVQPCGHESLCEVCSDYFVSFGLSNCVTCGMKVDLNATTP